MTQNIVRVLHLRHEHLTAKTNAFGFVLSRSEISVFWNNKVFQVIR